MDDRQRQLRDQFKAQERAKVREAMPISDEQAQALFDHLDVQLGQRECDHTRVMTDAWAVSQGVDVQKLHAWLNTLGGFCDCEVLSNAEEKWTESLRSTDRER